MGRNLAHDQERHPGLEIRPAPEAEPEHQARGETFRARRARDQPEQQRRCNPDGQEDEQRHGRPPRELVQRQRVRDCRSGQ